MWWSGRSTEMKNRQQWLLFAGGLIAGAAFGAGIALLEKYAHAHVPKPPAWIFFLAFACMPIPIVLHELGHVAAGLLSGFRFYLFVIGPLRIVNDNGRLRVHYNRFGTSWGGLAGCAPVTDLPNMRSRMLWFAAGGPLFSLLGGLIVFPAYSVAVSHPALSLIGIVLGGVSFLLAVVTLIPNRLSGWVSDGARIRMLLRNDREAMRWMAMGVLVGISTIERPRDWPPHLMDSLGDGDGPDGPSVCFLRHTYNRDRHEAQLAREWLEKGLAKMDTSPAPLQAAFSALAAYFYAREDGVANWDYYKRAANTGFQNKEDLLLVHAALLIADGHREQAAADIEAARKELPRKPAKLAESLLEEIEALQ
jgi:hypothetical protein